MITSTLAQSDIFRQCFNCGLPNVSSKLFVPICADAADSRHSFLFDISTASSLSDYQNQTDLTAHIGYPVFHSTSTKCSSHQHKLDSSLSSIPSVSSTSRVSTALVKTDQNLRTLVINFQSLRPKKAEFWNRLYTTNPDVILGTETWLKSDVTDAEVFPPNFNVFRKDRHGGYGGVLVATKKSLMCHEIQPASTTEIDSVTVLTPGGEEEWKSHSILPVSTTIVNQRKQDDILDEDLRY